MTEIPQDNSKTILDVPCRNIYYPQVQQFLSIIVSPNTNPLHVDNC